MKKLLPLLRLSAKEYFKYLKKQKIYSTALTSKVSVSRSFYKHITKKPRDIQDMAERLAMFPLVIKILKQGDIVSERNKYIKISYQVNTNSLLSCILYKETTHKISLISCFQDFHIQKK